MKMNFTRFRLNKNTVLKILEMLENDLEYQSDRNDSVTPMNQLLITLRFYATVAQQQLIGDYFGVHRSTVSRIISKVSPLIAKLSEDFVKFPMTQEERVKMMKEFYNSTMFPGVLGAIDCIHIAIKNPGGNNGEVYRNRKGYFSINVQLICDPNLYITDVVARWPGSVHDSTIFNYCHKKSLFENGHIEDGYLIGDGGFACTKYLLTPLINPTTEAEIKYNEFHIRTRNCIERTNGVPKSRFQSMLYGLRLKIDDVPTVIVAMVVLHNIARSLGDGDPPEDKDLEEYVQECRRLGQNIDYEELEVVPPPLINNHRSTRRREQLITGHFTNINM